MSEEEFDNSGNVEGISTPREKDSRWQYEYTDLMDRIRAKLYGGTLIGPDANGQVHLMWPDPERPGKYLKNKPKNVEAYMNERGIEDTLALLNFHVTKIQKLGVQREVRILQWAQLIDWELSKLYFAGMMQENESNPNDVNLYNLTPVKASNVIVGIMSLIENNSSGSIEGQALHGLQESERVTEVRTGAPRQKLLGIF